MAKLRVLPLVPERWPDLVTLFGARGACGGCWCMTPRLSRAEYEQNKGAGNKRKLHALVESGRVPGLIGYAGARPVAWCSIEPRSLLPTLGRSRVLAPVDDAEAWSIVCLFIDKAERGRGRSVAMIEAAVRYARARRPHRRGLPRRAEDLADAAGVRLDRPGFGLSPRRLRRGGAPLADASDHAPHGASVSACRLRALVRPRRACYS